MIKKRLAILAIGGLGALLIAAPGNNKAVDINKNERPVSEQVILANMPTFTDTLESTVDTIPKKTFQLPNVTPKDILYLAGTIYGEASGETSNERYVKGVVSTILNRAEKCGSIRRAVLETTINQKGERVYQYTCFDPSDPNYHRVMNFLNSERARKNDSIWNECHSIAKSVLDETMEIEEPLNSATHFFVRRHDPRLYTKRREATRRNFPSFAYEMTDTLFVLDENKNRIPREPVAVVPVRYGMKAFFYNLEE